MASRHTVKCWAPFFQAVKSGSKTHEIRLDDRGYQVGDVLELHEFDPKTETYTGGVLAREVTYISRNDPASGLPPLLQQDVVVMSIKPL